MRDPDHVHDHARQLLDCSGPIAVVFSGVLGHVVDDGESVRIVRTVLDAIPPGTHLLHQDGVDTDGANAIARDTYTDNGARPIRCAGPSCYAATTPLLRRTGVRGSRIGLDHPVRRDRAHTVPGPTR